LKEVEWWLSRRGMVEAYIEVCLAIVVLSSTTLVAISIVLSHVLLGG